MIKMRIYNYSENLLENQMLCSLNKLIGQFIRYICDESSSTVVAPVWTPVTVKQTVCQLWEPKLKHNT